MADLGSCFQQLNTSQCLPAMRKQTSQTKFHVTCSLLLHSSHSVRSMLLGCAQFLLTTGPLHMLTYNFSS